MITRVNDLPTNEFCDCAGVKIGALYKAYGGNYDFCRFFVQTDSSIRPLAIISTYEGAVTVSSVNAYGETASFELSEFLNALGFTELISRVPVDLKMPHEIIYEVHAENSRYNFNSCQHLAFHVANRHKALTEIYSIFQNADSPELSLPPFEQWYADSSHRMRHNAAVGFCCKSGAAFAHLDGRNAYLAGLAVLPQYRGRGTAKSILTELSGSGQYQRIFAFCREPLLKFYRSAGFSVGSAYYLYRNRQIF